MVIVITKENLMSAKPKHNTLFKFPRLTNRAVSAGNDFSYGDAREVARTDKDVDFKSNQESNSLYTKYRSTTEWNNTHINS